jgi:hypothetical protein
MIILNAYVVGIDPKDRHTVEKFYKRLVVPNKDDNICFKCPDYLGCENKIISPCFECPDYGRCMEKGCTKKKK